MALLIDRVFNAVLLSHLMVDLLNGMRSVLLTFLSGPLGLTNAALGVISTLYQIAAAAAQPIFGWVSDRFGSRWVVAGGVLWMGFFFSLALMVQGLAVVPLLILASIGSGAFHPAGTVQATLVGRVRMEGRETTAASLFFLSGQLGFFFGPIIAGVLLDSGGKNGLLWAALAALPVGIYGSLSLRQQLYFVHEPSSTQAAITKNKRRWLPVIALVVVAALQSWSQSNISTFLPKYLSDLGMNASLYGIVTAFFMGGSGIGNLVGGNLADRYGKAKIVAISLMLASIPLALLPMVGTTSLVIPVVALAGMLTGGCFTVIVVLAQRLIPGGMGLASGLVLGFVFTSGAIGASLSGILADAVGFPPVFLLSAGLALAGGFIALLIKE